MRAFLIVNLPTSKWPYSEISVFLNNFVFPKIGFPFQRYLSESTVVILLGIIYPTLRGAYLKPTESLQSAR